MSADRPTMWLCYSANFTNHAFGTTYCSGPPGKQVLDVPGRVYVGHKREYGDYDRSVSLPTFNSLSLLQSWSLSWATAGPLAIPARAFKAATVWR